MWNFLVDVSDVLFFPCPRAGERESCETNRLQTVTLQVKMERRQKAVYREASVRFGYGSVTERFGRFRFSVPAVPLQKRFFFVSYSLTGNFGFGKNGSDGSGSRFRFGS